MINYFNFQPIIEPIPVDLPNIFDFEKLFLIITKTITNEKRKTNKNISGKSL